MINNIILGTGYLSSNLRKNVKTSKVYSYTEFKKELKKFNKKKNKINLIINSFYSSKKLNNINSYKDFVKKSISEVSEVLDEIDVRIINKVLYTSSYSVYGSLNNKISFKDKNNR